MARYCFYCGRQLNPGEKCGCRAAGGTSSDQQAQQAKQTTSHQTGQDRAAGGKTNQTHTKWHQRLIQFFNPFSSRSQTGTAYKSSSARSTGTKKRQNRTRRTFRPIRLNRQTFITALRQAGQYIVRPADRIRTAVSSGSSFSVMVIIIVKGILGGVMMLIAVSQPHLQAILSLNIATINSGWNFGSQVFLFIQGFGIDLTASLLLVLIYYLVLRYVFRQPTGFRQLLCGLSPAFLYFSVFMLGGLMTLAGSLFSALLMLAAGFALSTVAQYFAVRQMTGFDDNRSFILTGFVLLLYSSVLSVLLNLSLPVFNALLDQSAVI